MSSQRLVVLVDDEGRQTGTREVRAAHEGAGALHLAFTALLFDARGRLLLAKRSADKMLWPGYWDGTVASHPLPEEPSSDAAIRRLDEELGLGCDLVEIGEFQYSIPFGDVGSETERCQTFLGVLSGERRVRPNPDEVDEVAWVELPQLFADGAWEQLCPWLPLALLRTAEGRVPGGPARAVVQPLIGYLESLRELVERSLGDHPWKLHGVEVRS